MSEHIWLVCWGPGVSVEGEDWALEDIQVDDHRWVYKIDDPLTLAASGSFESVMREMMKGLHAMPTLAGRRPVFYTGPLTYQVFRALAGGHVVDRKSVV